MRAGCHKPGCLSLVALLCLLCSVRVCAQPALVTVEIPDKFNLDLETAARLRPLLLSQSGVASGRYTTGRLVLEKLVGRLPASRDVKHSWELRIVDDDLLNAFSSPDGTIYVESGLARLASRSAGLWAAILSHEMAHVIRRDWARRYLYEKSLQSGGGATLVLGDPGLPSGTWRDSKKASEDLARFCRQMELDADQESLTLMARAGYHPDFVPALYHLLHAVSVDASTATTYAMHPRWEARDRQLERAYVAASIEFGQLWPDWYASPGGNPPIVVFAEEPTIRKNGSKEWEIQVPMRCQNLAGAVEVVLRTRPAGGGVAASVQPLPKSGQEVRQLTGCTSPKTTITFTLRAGSLSELRTDVFVLEDGGSVLSRAEVPRLRR